MSGRKNILSKFQLLSSADMSQLSTNSPVTNIQFLDNIAIQCNFTGSPSGSINIQVSNDYQSDFMGNVIDSGNWITVASAGTAGGSPAYFDLNQMAAPYIRVNYTSTGIESGSVQSIADTGALSQFELTFEAKASMVDGEYLVLSDANGNEWAIASNISGTTPVPTGAIWTAIPSGRKAQVDLSSGAIVSAADVAAAFLAAFNLLSGFSALITLDDSAADGTMLVNSLKMGVIANPQSLLEDDSGAGGITFVSNVVGASSNLLNTYFIGSSTLSGGAISHWLIYINVNSEGVAPADPNPAYSWTKIAASVAAGANANTVAAAIKTAMDASLTAQLSTPVTNVADLVSFSQGRAGPGSLSDSIAAPCGFTFVYNGLSGSLNAFISAKMI